MVGNASVALLSCWLQFSWWHIPTTLLCTKALLKESSENFTKEKCEISLVCLRTIPIVPDHTDTTVQKCFRPQCTKNLRHSNKLNRLDLPIHMYLTVWVYQRTKTDSFWNVVFVWSGPMEIVLKHISGITHVTPLSKNLWAVEKIWTDHREFFCKR